MRTWMAFVMGLGILGGCGGGDANNPPQGSPPPSVSQDKVKDPVCGMMIDKASAKGHHDYKEGHYYFCSDDCLGKFKAAPEKYVK